MRLINSFLISFFMLASCLFQACIHEYPVPVLYPGGGGAGESGGGSGNGNDPNGGGGIGGGGENPSTVNGYIELSYDLSWENLYHTIDFSSKAGREKNHRFIVEVSHEGNRIMHDVEYIDDEEFASGRFRRKLSVPLEAKEYKIAAWYDRMSPEGNNYFDADNLQKISIKNSSTTDTLAFHCAYSSDILDLKGYSASNQSKEAVKQLEMQLPGARIRIVATDVQAFITEQKEALNQGDKFTSHIEFIDGGHNSLDAFETLSFSNGEEYNLSGWMRLPFAAYEELTIAQGFVFCRNENNVNLRLRISNSALATVSTTDVFTVPVKRGYITVVKGDFLTHPIDGFFTVDHVWAGEIIYEI